MKLIPDDSLLIAGLTYRERLLLWVFACNADSRGLVTAPRKELATKFYETVEYMDAAVRGMRRKGILLETSRGYKLIIGRQRRRTAATSPTTKDSEAVHTTQEPPLAPPADTNTPSAGNAPMPQV